MITDLVELNDFVVLIEESDAAVAEVERCLFDDEIIGISFYASGNVEMEVSYGDQKQVLHNHKGMAVSFFGNEKVRFAHTISPDEPLRSISVFAVTKNIRKLPQPEREIYLNGLDTLLHAQHDFEVGSAILMTPEMQKAVLKVFQTHYQDKTKLLFIKSQVTELLAHFFAELDRSPVSEKIAFDEAKMVLAKDIISKNLSKPPSLNELSRMIGLNSNKLKKNFKEAFGIPVFKYLQEERLTKAHELLREDKMTVQEISWYVGYESLSSFSNAFVKKFGCRPSQVGNLLSNPNDDN